MQGYSTLARSYCTHPETDFHPVLNSCTVSVITLVAQVMLYTPQTSHVEQPMAKSPSWEAQLACVGCLADLSVLLGAWVKSKLYVDCRTEIKEDRPTGTGCSADLSVLL